MIQVLTIWEKMEEISNDFRDWILKNYANPILWIGIIVVGFVVFKSVYSTLNKGE